jgi:GNAT superfamily N-acetyltransferase
MILKSARFASILWGQLWWTEDDCSFDEKDAAMKSVASRLTYEVRPFQDEDTSQVLNLLTLVLGSGLVGERSSVFFCWKHVHNPFGRSFMLVADGGGRIIGFRAFMRWQFLGAEGGLRAVQAVDTATHPDFQRQGVFSRLTKAALNILRDEADLVFNTPNDNSRPAYLKLGWTEVGGLPVTMQACHPLRLVSRYLVDRPATNQPTPAVDAPSAATVLQAESEQIGALLAEAEAPIDRIRTRRSLDFLRWRYSTTLNLDYRAITEHRKGRLSGLVIFRVRPRGALWEN